MRRWTWGQGMTDRWQQHRWQPNGWKQNEWQQKHWQPNDWKQNDWQHNAWQQNYYEWGSHWQQKHWQQTDWQQTDWKHNAWRRSDRSFWDQSTIRNKNVQPYENEDFSNEEADCVRPAGFSIDILAPTDASVLHTITVESASVSTSDDSSVTGLHQECFIDACCFQQKAASEFVAMSPGRTATIDAMVVTTFQNGNGSDVEVFLKAEGKTFLFRRNIFA